MVSALFLAAGLARAQPVASDSGVTTELDSCVGLDAAQFHRILSIELGTGGGRRPATAEDGSTRVRIDCVQEGIRLWLHDGVTRKSMERVLRRDQLSGDEAERLLALSVAEFVVASWIELSVQPKPSVEPVGERPTTAETSRVQQVVEQRVEVPLGPKEPTWSLSGTAVLHAWPGAAAECYGGALKLSHRLLPALAFAIDGQFQVGGAVGRSSMPGFEAERFELDIMHASLGAALLGHLALGPLEFYGGVGVRIAWVRITPDQRDVPQPIASGGAPSGGAFVAVRLAAGLSSALRFVVDLEAGYVALPVDGLAGAEGEGLGVETILRLQEMWVSAALGLALAF